MIKKYLKKIQPNKKNATNKITHWEPICVNFSKFLTNIINLDSEMRKGSMI